MAEVLKPFAIEIDIKKPVNNEPFELVQGDNGNVLTVTVVNDGVPVDLTDCIVMFVFSHSGITVEQDSDTEGGDVTIGGDDNNEVTIRIHSGSYDPDGLTECEIGIYSGATHTTLITTPIFNFTAHVSLLNDETIASVVQFPILVRMIEIVSALEEREQSNYAETDDTKGSFIRNKPVINADIQAAISALDIGTPDTNDYVAFLDSTDGLHKKALLSTLFTKIFGSITGIVKANGTGGISQAETNVDFAAAEHALRHASGGADAITPADIGAAALENGVVKAAQAKALIDWKTGSFTLQSSQAEKLIFAESASSIVVTLPSSLSVDDGTAFNFVRWGTGAVSFAAGSGANIYASNNVTAISARFCSALAVKINNTVWWLSCG